MTLAAWATLEPGLTAVFADAAGAPLDNSGFRDGRYRMKSRGNGTRLDWSIVSTRGIGRDEIRIDYDPDATIEGDSYAPPGGSAGDLGGFVETSYGNRTMTLQVVVDTDKGSGREMVETLRARMNLPSYRARVRALGLAVIWAGPAIDVGRGAEDEGGRPPSVWAIELECNATSAVADAPITTIETVRIQARIATDKEPFGPL